LFKFQNFIGRGILSLQGRFCRMTLQNIRFIAIQKMENEIEHFQKELTQMREKHLQLQQKLFDSSKDIKMGVAPLDLIKETDSLKREIGELVVSIRSVDSKISRLKNRAKRFKRNS